MTSVYGYVADTLAWVANAPAIMETLPTSGIGQIVADGAVLLILQRLRPRGQGHSKSAMRIAMRALQCATTTYVISIPSPLTAAGIGGVMSAIGEWRTACRETRLAATDQKVSALLVEQVEKYIACEHQFAKVQAQKKQQHICPSQRFRLQAAAEARIKETLAHVAADSTQMLKVLADFLARHSWPHLSPEGLSQGTSEAVLRLVGTYDPSDCISVRRCTIFRRLAMRYVIYERWVSSVDDINRAIDWARTEKNKRIKLLWISAHGCDEGMALTEKLVPGIALQKIHFSRLDPQASVWLDGCAMGVRPANFLLSPAEWIKLEAGPFRRVFASTKNIKATSLELVDVEHCIPAMYDTYDETSDDYDDHLRNVSKSQKKALKRFPFIEAFDLVDRSNPTLVEPRYVPAVKQFKRQEDIFMMCEAMEREASWGYRFLRITQAVRRAFCCGCRRGQ